MIHFNNAGASLPPDKVANCLYSYLRDEEMRGGYEVMAERAGQIQNFYSAVAQLLNCSTEEIAFTDSATRAWNAAFYALDLQRGDQVLASSAEYGSNLVAMLHRARKEGIEIVWVPDNPSGHIDVQALEKFIGPRVKLICLTLVPSGSGVVNPAADVGRIAQQAGIPYLLDACQALGQLPVDVETIGCDMLCGTGRKFLRGPRGTGLLYVRKSQLDNLEPSQLNHHAAKLLSTNNFQIKPDAKRFECWERSYAGQAALGVAIDYALEWGLENIRKRIDHLAKRLRQELADIDSARLVEPDGAQCGIISFRSTKKSAQELQRQLAHHHINTSTVMFDANPFKTQKAGAPAALRVSLHYYNTIDEIQEFITKLRKSL
jgi:selenocysteine lyase/cysteine desulfurase